MTALYDKLAHHAGVYFKLNNLPPEHVEPLAQHLSGNTEPLREGEPDPRLVRLVRAAEALLLYAPTGQPETYQMEKALAPYDHLTIRGKFKARREAILLERAEKEN